MFEGGKYIAKACWNAPEKTLNLDCTGKGVIILDFDKSFLGYRGNCGSDLCCANYSRCQVPVSRK